MTVNPHVVGCTSTGSAQACGALVLGRLSVIAIRRGGEVIKNGDRHREARSDPMMGVRN